MALVLDGKVVSIAVKNRIKTQVSALGESASKPGLAVVLVGEDPGSVIYVGNKEKACREMGFHSIVHRLPTDTSEDTLLTSIHQLNLDPKIHGILVQLPLPNRLDAQKMLLAIDPRKDVDGLHPNNLGRLVSGMPGPKSCTPYGVMEMLHYYQIPISGRRAVVVGRSNMVGKPMAQMLLAENATVTMCHSRTADLASETKRADILVAAIGKARFITADMVQQGVVVVDVGTNRLPGQKLCGDVDFDPVFKIASAISPVPGGVGLMTIAMLMKNTYDAFLEQTGL
jgi:methylenetetrahydrofolate dehydrogenase (NADP+) / methenyltetrahydrofolate cyclohydrolase